MMIKYSYSAEGHIWGIYGLKVLVLNNEVRVMLIDLPENLGVPLETTFAAVATEIVTLLISEQHVSDPASVHWMHGRLRDPEGDPVDWREMFLTWRDNRYWIAPL